jgi:dolichyl-phosphate-mannose-protein mannosyltransferase
LRRRTVSTTSTWLGVCLLLALGVRLLLAFVPGYIGDQSAWAILARQAVEQGVPHIYALTLREPGLGVYPPLYHYLLASVGIIYQQFFSASLTLPSGVMYFLLKLVPILGDCAIGLLIYGGVRRLADDRTALGAALIYLFSPAVIFMSAYWGMFGDSIYSFCVLFALLAVTLGRPNLALISIVAGVSIKPQAAVFVPLIIWAVLQSTRPRQGLQAGLVGALTLGVVWMPFIAADTLSEALTALQQTIGLFPILSANAHNLWYLLSLGHSWVSDATPLIGPLTARTIGLMAFGSLYLYLLYRSYKTTLAGQQLCLLAAYIAFAFFMLSTEMHENYIFPTLVLLTVACWQSKFLRALLLVLTMTALANMALHDSLFRPTDLSTTLLFARLALLNSAINSILFVLWTYYMLFAIRQPRSERVSLNRFPKI